MGLCDWGGVGWGGVEGPIGGEGGVGVDGTHDTQLGRRVYRGRQENKIG